MAPDGCCWHRFWRCRRRWAAAQGTYPNKPIRYIVPFAPGGTTDILARVVGEKLAIALGQPLVIDNKPGQGGSAGAGELARAAPDGYTIGGGTISSHGINATLYDKLPYDPVKSFEPITHVRHAAQRAAAAPERAGQQPARVHRAAEGQPGEVLVRLGRQRHLAAHLGRDVQDAWPA